MNENYRIHMLLLVAECLSLNFICIQMNLTTYLFDSLFISHPLDFKLVCVCERNHVKKEPIEGAILTWS